MFWTCTVPRKLHCVSVMWNSTNATPSAVINRGIAYRMALLQQPGFLVGAQGARVHVLDAVRQELRAEDRRDAAGLVHLVEVADHGPHVLVGGLLREAFVDRDVVRIGERGHRLLLQR